MGQEGKRKATAPVKHTGRSSKNSHSQKTTKGLLREPGWRGGGREYWKGENTMDNPICSHHPRKKGIPGSGGGHTMGVFLNGQVG